MVWCGSCKADVQVEVEESGGLVCCTLCGRVLEDHVFSTDPTFSKTAGGASQVDGVFLSDAQGQASALGMHRPGGGGGGGGRSGPRLYGLHVDSHERTLSKGKYELTQIAERLGLRPREELVGSAHRIYKLAVMRQFTRGRRTNQVAAACLYLVCRQENRPFMLIDFSDSLQTNVFVLGAVYLHLCRLLRLDQHPLLQRPVDPSLFIHRFADRLDFGKRMHPVANTALRLVASMKRDWMQTGRRPSGICGAALLIAAHAHGFERSKRDVIAVVHVCEATLKKRLTEFESTEASALTISEFEQQAKELETQLQLEEAAAQAGEGELTCEHKDSNEPHFARGMCAACYREFIQVSGGLGGGVPPAFLRAEKKRLKALMVTEAEARLRLTDGAETNDVLALTYRDGSALTAADEVEEEMNATLGGGDLEDALTSMSNPGEAPAASAPPLAQRRPGVHRLGGMRDLPPPLPPRPLKPRNTTRPQPAAPSPSQAEAQAQPQAQAQAQTQTQSQALAQSSQDLGASPVPNASGPGRPDAGNVAAAHVEGNSAAAETVVGGTENGTQLDANAGAIVVHEGAEHEEEQKAADEDVDTLSDIDDDEVNGYIHSNEEAKVKELVWSELNKEYIETQAVKAAALAASELAQAKAAADNTATPEELAIIAANMNKVKKERKRKAPGESKGPPASAAAAATQMLASRKLSSKVNYTALAQLFESDAAAEQPPAKRAASKRVQFVDEVAHKVEPGSKPTTTGADDDEDEEEEEEEVAPQVDGNIDSAFRLPYEAAMAGGDYDYD
eukprot:jgi/Chlat1/496/Chrsp103S01101